MPTQEEIRREMYRLMPDIGEALDANASASSTTITLVNNIDMMRVASRKVSEFEHKWAILSGTADAQDRVRLITAVTNSATPTFTTNIGYSGSLTNQDLEVTRYEPRLIDEAINRVLQRMHREHRTVVPTGPAGDFYPLNNLSWLDSPADIKRVMWRPDPVMTRNRYMQQWEAYSSATQYPEEWTFAAIATTAPTRVSSRNLTSASVGMFGLNQDYVLSIAETNGGDNVDQEVTVQFGGITGDSLRGGTVTGVLVGWADTATGLRLSVVDTTTTSATHTGGGAWEELTVSHTVAAASDHVTLRITTLGNETYYVAQCYLINGSLDDAVRRDTWREHDISRLVTYEQFADSMALRTHKTFGVGQLVVYSERPYEELTTDAHSTDAPIETVAVGAVGKLYENLAFRTGEDPSRYREIAATFNRRFEKMVLRGQYSGTNGREGIQLPPRPIAAMPRRY